MPANVLVVEDEPAIAEVLSVTLLHAGYFPLRVTDAQVAVTLIAKVLPDLILLSRNLPENSAIEFLQALRRDNRCKHVPVVMLSTLISEEDYIEGLEAGADDYLLKPFSPRTLLARVKALLRRRAPQFFEDMVSVHGLTLDPTSHRAYIAKDDVEIQLKVGPMEFKILHYFLTNPEKVHSRVMLLNQVWGDHTSIEERTVDVHIKRLRTILKPVGYAPIIETVRGSGYRLSAQGMIEAAEQSANAALLAGTSSETGGPVAVGTCR